VQSRPMSIPGAVEFTPRQHADKRGVFLEWFRADALTEAMGRGMDLAQANLSVSARGVVRGIHYARAVYLSEGLGHGFCSLTDQAMVTYFSSQPYAPEREHAVNAFDAEIGIDWGGTDLTSSDRDAVAPSLAEALAAGILPDFADCGALVDRSRKVPSAEVSGAD